MQIFFRFSDAFRDYLTECACKKRRNSIADLLILMHKLTKKNVVIRKGLYPCGFTDGQHSVLRRVKK